MRIGALRKTLAAAAVLAAVVLLGLGLRRNHKIYEPDAGQVGLAAFTFIGERQLVIDTTFSGVQRRGHRLVSTYDRSAPRGKRTCPT